MPERNETHPLMMARRSALALRRSVLRRLASTTTRYVRFPFSMGQAYEAGNARGIAGRRRYRCGS